MVNISLNYVVQHEEDTDATQQNGTQQNDEDENQQSKRKI